MKRTSTVLSFAVALATTLHAQTSVETLRAASSEDLATSYREQLQITSHFALVEEGGTLHLPNQIVSRDNLEQVKVEVADRMAAVGAAITDRGYATVAGTYVPKATSECKRIPSGWAGSIASGAVSRITVSQDTFELLLVQQFTIEGESGTYEIKGVIVDSTIVFDDMMNSDFGLVGQAAGGTIKVRPQVDQILAAWPSWVKAPNRKDLSRCEVTLTRVAR